MARISEAELKTAFSDDGYVAEPIKEFHGYRGVLARSKQNPERTAIYVEGPAYERGYLIGLLAYEKVERMASQFVDNIIPAFVAPRIFHPLRFVRLKSRLMNILRDRCMTTYYKHPDDIPRYLKDEMMGIAAGCKACNPRTSVNYKELFLLNAGIDFILSYVYTGADRVDWITHLKQFDKRQENRSQLHKRVALSIKAPRIRAQQFHFPFGCNAFSMGRNLTQENRHYFGRDFMFPTAGVFQDTCCFIVYNPQAKDQGKSKKNTLPIVSVTAPGFVGSVTAMNTEGVALGVDMLPGENCNFHRPGLNSLLMVRYCADHARDLDEAADLIIQAQRGVSWLYVMADGKTGRSAAIEAGMKTTMLQNISYIPKRYELLLSDRSYNDTSFGAMVRENGYVPAADIPDLNSMLFAMRKKSHHFNQERPDGRYHTRKRKPWKQRALPRSFYFPPQRESRSDLLIATNQAITPEMRLCSMGSWISLVAAHTENDLQWRYDELNHQIREALGQDASHPNKITFEQAKALIDFLSPLRKFPDYYKRNAKSDKGKRIEGAIALCDLTKRVMHAYYGYYDNDWVQLTLSSYCGQ